MAYPIFYLDYLTVASRYTKLSKCTKVMLFIFGNKQIKCKIMITFPRCRELKQTLHRP